MELRHASEPVTRRRCPAGGPALTRNEAAAPGAPAPPRASSRRAPERGRDPGQPARRPTRAARRAVRPEEVPLRPARVGEEATRRGPRREGEPAAQATARPDGRGRSRPFGSVPVLTSTSKRHGRAARPSLERILHPVHRWVWRDAHRCARKLMTFAATEADGGRDLSRAAELTADPLLRRLFLRHALDEHRHAELFRARGRTLLAALAPRRRRLVRGELARPRRARARRPAGRGRGRRGAARLPPPLREGRRRALRGLPRRHRGRGDARGLPPVLATRCSTCATREPARARRAASGIAAHLWVARAARLWKGYLRVATALAARARHRRPPRAVLPRPAVLRARGEAGGAPRAPRLERARAARGTGRAREPVLSHEDPRHLRALPRLRRGARRGRRAGRAQSRRSGSPGARTTPAFPLARHRVVPRRGRASSPDDLDAVVFYEKPMLKFERILVDRAARVPALLAELPAGDEEHARREGVGEGHHRFAPGRPARKILFTEHHQSHAAAAFLTAPTREAAILTADGVGEWATLTVGRGSSAPTARARSSCCASCASRTRSGCSTRPSPPSSGSR